MLQKNFYRAFEDRYRGSRVVILGRLQIYVDFLAPLKGLFKNASAIDLGCGRGEFLEVLLSAGFKAKGIDLDAGMLQACTELKLPAEKGDALAFLAKLPKQSQVVVSAFHVVEHMPFEQLQILVADAYRVLKPGGILILETPNPENITVATANFYLDPTHQRPIPPQLLSFVGEYAGFERVKILRLQESPTLKEKQNVDLADVLSGASPDYSIVAQKAGSKRATKALDGAFAKDYGLTASELAARYENFRQRSIEQLGQADVETKSEIGAVHEMIKSEATEVRAKLEQAAGELGAVRAEKEALALEREKAGAELAEARAKLEQAAGELGAVRAEKEALALEREKAGAELAEARANLEQAAGELGAARAVKKALAVEREKAAAEVSELRTKLEQAAGELGAVRAEKEALAAEREKAGTELSEVRAKLEQAAGELGAVRAAKEALVSQTEKLARSLADKSTRLEAEISKVNTLSSDKLSLNSELRKTVDALGNLRQELQQVLDANHHHWQLSEDLKKQLQQALNTNHHHWQLSEDLKKQLEQTLEANHHHWQLCEQRQQRIDELLQSTCWRITAPLRWLKGEKNTPSEPIEQKLLKQAALYIRERPKLKKEALKILFRNPALHARVIPIVTELRGADSKPPVALGTAPLSSPLISEAPSPTQADHPVVEVASTTNLPDLSRLSSHARRIYEQLSTSAAKVP